MTRPWTSFWYKLDLCLWWCEDEICDCYQARIDLAYPNQEAGQPWIRRIRQWEGTFHSSPDGEELRGMREELVNAAWWFGIPLIESKLGELYGWHEISKEYAKLLLANPMETR